MQPRAAFDVHPDAGVIVVNWDSLVSTDQLTAIVNTDQIKWGNMTAQWLVDQIGGSGPILAINGPAGISVSEARWAGAKEIFDANPDVEIVGTANIEYNEAPALTEMESLLAAHPDIVGIWCQAGAHASAALKTMQPVFRLPLHEYEMMHAFGGNRTGSLMIGSNREAFDRRQMMPMLWGEDFLITDELVAFTR